MRTHTLFWAVLFSLFLSPVFGADPAPSPSPRLKVGVFDRPPFALKDDDGHWSGLAIDLWEKIARDLNLSFDYVETSFDNLIPNLTTGHLDIVVGELGVSAEREKVVDFTQPYLTTSAAVAFSQHSQGPKWKDISVKLSQHGVFLIILAMVLTLIIFSILLWFVERRIQKGHFGGKPIHGMGSALWFSAVTMTTVGYGDKTPQTPLGRALAFVWMFSGILLVSAFTGAIASSFTVSSLNMKVNRVSDLVQYRNGVLAGSLAQEVLNGLGVPAVRFPTVEAGLKALQQGDISSFVASDVSLRYLNRHDFDEQFEIVTLPTTHVSYAMATRPDFSLLQDINVDLIKITTNISWQREIDVWLGSSTGK